jgi:predicted dienelactone hydrolase
MRLFLTTILATLLACACSNSTEKSPLDVASDSTADLWASDLTGPDSNDAAPDPEAQADLQLWPHGCVADLCAAGPESAPDPRNWGPFPVGLRTFETSLYDHKNVKRKLVVDVTYPTTEEFRDGPFEAIDLVALAPDDVKELMPAMEIESIPVYMVRDADMRTQDGPYPLVIFSHGAFGVRFQSVFFTQYLASHGYIVVSPDHVGNTLYDMIKMGGYSMDPVVESAFDRPLDVDHLITLMLEWNELPSSFYYATINPERIGMSGHSFGGYTSFYQGFEDPRIKAILPMAPATQQLAVFGFKMGEFPIPTMVMAGGKDKTLDTEKDMTLAYEQLPAPKYYFELKTAGHYSFTDICSLNLKQLADDIGFGDAEDALEDGCGPENVDVAFAHPLIRQFGIGFLNAHLRDSPGSAIYYTAEEGAKYSDELIYLVAE